MALPTRTTLRRGDRGDRVKEVQRLLNIAAGARLAEDGDFGAGTARAVAAFQKSAKLQETGVVDAPTLLALQTRAAAAAAGSSPSTTSAAARPAPGPAAPAAPPAGGLPTLKRGDTGRVVLALQKDMNAAAGKFVANVPGAVAEDGTFDDRLEAAVKRAQKAYGLPDTGVADPTFIRRVAEQAVKARADRAQHRPPAADANVEAPPGAAAPATFWESVSSKANEGWQSLKASAAKLAEHFTKSDGDKHRAEIERFVASLAAAKANLDAIRPYVSSTPETEGEKHLAQNYYEYLARYKVLAANFYPGAKKSDADMHAIIGIVPVVVAVAYAGGFAISALAAAWAVHSWKYAEELRDQTALQRQDLEARIAASKEGRVLQTSTTPVIQPDAAGLPKPGGVSAGLVAGILAALAAAGGGAWFFFRGRHASA